MDFTYKSILHDYELLKKTLDNYHFNYLTQQEISAKKSALKEQLALDTCFKLLTKLEADFRTLFNNSVEFKVKKGLGKFYNELCDEHRLRKHCYNQTRSACCRHVRFEDILATTIKFYNEGEDRALILSCQTLQHYFARIGFRNWYAHGRYFKHKPKIMPKLAELKLICDLLHAKVFTAT